MVHVEKTNLFHSVDIFAVRVGGAVWEGFLVEVAARVASCHRVVGGGTGGEWRGGGGGSGRGLVGVCFDPFGVGLLLRALVSVVAFRREGGGHRGVGCQQVQGVGGR